MSQHVMESPSKRVRHDSADSSYLGHHAPESPIQQTSTGANPDQSLFGFEFSDTPTFGGGVTPSLPYLPSQVPNSKDWIMSPTAAFSTLPEGFGADPLSPGFSAGVPSHTGVLKGSNHPRGHRNAHKRGAGAGASSSLYHDDEDFGELGMGAGIAGMAGMTGPLDDDLSGGNALSPGAVIMDEESQEHLSTNRRALADILSRKSRTGRATPDVMASDEQEGTRHGFSNSSSNFNNCSDAFINSNNKNNNSNNSTNGNNQGFLSSFSHLSGALSGNSGSLFEQATQPQHNNNNNNESTLSARASWNKTQPEEIKTEKGARAKQKANTAATTSAHLNLANLSSINNSAHVKEESDDDCNSNQHSQQSAASSHMAGLLAITAAAETLPFPSSDERAPAGSKGKKGKAKRSYATSLNCNSKPFPSEVGEQGEHSNLSCESNSSGHSAVGSAALAGLNAAEVAGSIQASFMAAYGTPAMKLTSSIASASSTNKPITCNCKRSRCLKMYCDCFRLTIYCKDTCRCKECANLESRAVERQAAIASIVDRNPEAFKPRVTADPTSNSKAHLTGCHCRKSSCLKKYCECFTGAVPCGERCRCLDCKNGPAIYGAGGNGSNGNADLQHRLSLSAALSAAGVDRSNNNRRKDSIGSEGNSMDVMSAIMNDKSKRQYNSAKSNSNTSTSCPGAPALAAASSSSSSVLRSELVGAHGLGSPHMSPHGHLNMGNMNTMGNFGTLAMGLSGAPYFDPEGSNMSHMTTQSLSYSNDAFGRPMYGNFAARLSKSDSKLAFSPPRPGTDPSSGANSNRSVLDNEDAAEVLSAMNSPNAYMSAPTFGGIGSSSVGGAGGAGGEVPAYRYRDHVMSSVDTNYTAHSPGPSSQVHSSGGRMFAKGLLRAELETADDEEEDDILRPLRDSSATAGSAPGSARVRDMARRTASLGLDGHHANMSIETEDSLVVSSLGSTTAMVSNLSDNSNRFTPYSSPVKGRRPITENMVLSPTLLDLASICEQKAEEEEERKQQLTSPDRTRSYP